MKKIINKALDFYNNPKYKSIISYLFFGVCTTLVNIISYYILTRIGLERIISNFTSITLSIIFAYFVNAKYVFSSKATGIKKILSELSVFFSSRLFTMFIEIVGVELFVFIGIQDFIGKIITQFIVIVANYFISKYIVFKK